MILLLVSNMQYDEFVQLVSHGFECFFYINNMKYWISNDEDGYYLTPERQDGALTYQEFMTGDELVRNARIDGKTLKEWWPQISNSFL